jgi:hypothetical protein
MYFIIFIIWIDISVLQMVQTNAFVISSPVSKLPITMPFYTRAEQMQYYVLQPRKHAVISCSKRSHVYMRIFDGDDKEERVFLRSWKNTKLSLSATLVTILFITWTSFTFITCPVASANSDAYSTHEKKPVIPPTSIEIKSKPKNAYWNTIADPNSSKADIQHMNEKLFDQVVGNINTLYYDNSGGADFYPKDFYDRWKVLKAYAYHGIEGVIDLGMFITYDISHYDTCEEN